MLKAIYFHSVIQPNF